MFRTSPLNIDNRTIYRIPFNMEVSPKDLFIPLIISVATIFALFVVRNIVFKFLHKWADKAEINIGDLVIATFV